MTKRHKKTDDDNSEPLAEQELAPEEKAFLENRNAESRLRCTLYALLGKWTGEDVQPSDDIPIVRGGSVLGRIQCKFPNINPIDTIVRASNAEDYKKIKEKIEALQKLADVMQQGIRALNDIEKYERARLNWGPRWGKPANDDLGKSLEERILREVGMVESSLICADTLAQRATDQANELQRELDHRDEPKKGRPKDEAAYKVAEELAKLYAKVTGERPTY